MKITHSSKIKASEDFVVDYKIPDDPDYWKREEQKRIQRELDDEADAYDLEHDEGIYAAEDASPDIKPSGGDMINYVMVYTGPGYENNTPQAVLEWGKSQGFDKMYWGSDTAYGMKGMYNGDTYILYKDASKLPSGYKEDALDAEEHDRVMSATAIEGATQEEMQRAFEEYQKKQQELMNRLDDLQNDQLSKAKKRKKFFSKAQASEENPVCHKVSEDENSINYVVASEDIVCGTKWMAKYLKPDGTVKNVYFCLDTEDWNEAEQELENIITEPYQSCKLLGKAPNTIIDDDTFTFIESATRAVNGQLTGEIQAQLHYEVHRYLVDVQGFDEENVPGDITNIPADSIFVVEVYKTEEGAICAEVRAELSYESMDELADLLNEKVIQKYDPDAYFEQVEPGIMEAYLYTDNVKGATDVTAARFEGADVDDLRDDYLEPDEEDDSEGIDDFEQEEIVNIDVDIDIAEDGSYDYESYDFAKDSTFNGNYYVDYDDLAEKVKLVDYMSVVEDIDQLLANLLPDVKGKHHITGVAHLIYNVSGLRRSFDDGLVYDYNVEVTFDKEASYIDKFTID